MGGEREGAGSDALLTRRVDGTALLTRTRLLEQRRQDAALRAIGAPPVGAEQHELAPFAAVLGGRLAAARAVLKLFRCIAETQCSSMRLKASGHAPDP